MSEDLWWKCPLCNNVFLTQEEADDHKCEKEHKMTCKNCLTEINVQDNFCRNCGKSNAIPGHY